MNSEVQHENAEEPEQLRIIFSGGLADSGVLLFAEYTEALEGWRHLFEITGRMYLRSIPELRRLPPRNLLRLEIVGERRGSFETVLTFILYATAGGIIGNRADAAAVWSYKKLLQWIRASISNHVSAKKRTTNIEELAAALERMATQYGIEFEPLEVADEEQLTLVDVVEEKGEDKEEGIIPPVTRARAAAEAIDQALQGATRPLDSSCESISVVPDKEPALLTFDRDDRIAIAAQLTLALPTGEWRLATVRFIRINRKTGRALFLFENEPQPEEGAHYSKIVDPSVRLPGNVYTHAFDADTPLGVWVRRRAAERGRLNFLWEITAETPEGTLFH